NQPIERFFGLMKAEYYYRKRFNTLSILEEGIDQFIQYYNERRITLKFNGLAPLAFRRKYLLAS
ncbi:MAG: IS3 family transposase, partial [Carnobacterium sp.]|uniref:IS3 family transposase n=1 Tax=Carnobacterium sp. TaxID=48221 RepID=UPI003314F358